jgi:hypothetical protein
VEWFSVTRQENFKLVMGIGYEMIDLDQNVSNQSTNVRDGTGKGASFGTIHADAEYWFYGENKEWGVLAELNFSKPEVEFTPASVFNAGDISDYSTFRVGAMAARRVTYGDKLRVIMSAGLKRLNRYLIRRESNIFFADPFKEFYFAQEIGLEYYPKYGKYYGKVGLQFVERVDNLDTWSFIPTAQWRWRKDYLSYGFKYQIFSQTLNFDYTDSSTGATESAEVQTSSQVLLLQLGIHY